MGREGFYRAYKTEQEAREAAKELRTPRGSKKHGLGYPVAITVQFLKGFFGGAWGVYIYKRKTGGKG